MDVTQLHATKITTGLLPKEARRYVAHTVRGKPLRELAREAGCHPSTILRQVRKLESLRDDPLVDRALSLIETEGESALHGDGALAKLTDALQHLAGPGALLVYNRDLARPAIVQFTGAGDTTVLATIPVDIAATLVFRNWIAQDGGSAVKRYRITTEGRLSLPDLVTTRDKGPMRACGNAADPFAEPVTDRRSRDRSVANGPGTESPLIALSRRRGPDGKPFLSAGFVAAGDRLHEDFGIAGFGKTDLLGWESPDQLDRFYAQARLTDDTSRADAITRTLNAIRDLGPGLSDVALRCCCLREGLESAEKRMGWSARSGKVVLRIALQRLSLFYATHRSRDAALIG